MIAARLRFRIEILSPDIADSRLGGKTAQGWQSRGVFYAERVRMSGRMADEAGERFPDYSVEFNVREYVDVQEKWRLRDLSPEGKEYVVTGIIPNRARGFKTLCCQRRNP